ncbi:MAG: chitinase [Clostridia bacterium]|nr:chitinase [Clostridia bacterium]
MKKAAYVWDWYLKSVDERDIAVLDIINIAFGKVRNNVLDFDKPSVPAEIARIHAQKPGMKILLSVGGWGAGGFSVMCRTAEGIAEFAASCVDAVETYGLDGIDLDWEYPTIDSAGIDADPSDRENFTLLLRALRDALDKAYPDTHKMLTIAAGAGKYYVDAVEIPEIVKVLDYISLMTYDMRGAWSPAGHHTALYGSPSADETVRLFHEAGVPVEKLMIGAAFYSRKWTNIPEGGTHGLGQACDDPDDRESGMFGPGFARLAEDYIDKNGYTAYYDEECGASWLYNETERTLISYDDERSVAAKAKYAAETGLYGVMYWEHSCDPTRRLMNALAEGE